MINVPARKHLQSCREKKIIVGKLATLRQKTSVSYKDFLFRRVSILSHKMGRIISFSSAEVTKHLLATVAEVQ